MKKYLFKNSTVTLIVKAPNEFMAMCYANDYMEKRFVARFDTTDAIELDNDMGFGVIVAISETNIEFFNSENLFYK